MRRLRSKADKVPLGRSQTNQMKQGREIGVPPQRGRTTAIRQLVLQAPVPVIAKALGYHDKTATRLVTEAGGTGADTPRATTHDDARTDLTGTTRHLNVRAAQSRGRGGHVAVDSL
jgi:hypothetical protein